MDEKEHALEDEGPVVISPLAIEVSIRHECSPVLLEKGKELYGLQDVLQEIESEVTLPLDPSASDRPKE